MIRINIHHAKTPLSRYLAHPEAGETIVICRRNQPIEHELTLRTPDPLITQYPVRTIW